MRLGNDGDQRSALPHVLVAGETERRGLAGMMTAGALIEDDRRDLFSKADRMAVAAGTFEQAGDSD